MRCVYKCKLNLKSNVNLTRKLYRHFDLLIFSFFFPQENWIGGWVKNGREFTGFDGIRERLETHFELLESRELPLLSRETERTFHWSVSHATVWRRR